MSEPKHKLKKTARREVFPPPPIFSIRTLPQTMWGSCWQNPTLRADIDRNRLGR